MLKNISSPHSSAALSGTKGKGGINVIPSCANVNWTGCGPGMINSKFTWCWILKIHQGLITESPRLNVTSRSEFLRYLGTRGARGARAQGRLRRCRERAFSMVICVQSRSNKNVRDEQHQHITCLLLLEIFKIAELF